MIEKSGDTNFIYYTTTKIHGSKMRMDQVDNKNVNFSVIVDLETHDAITLMHRNKTYLKRSGEQARQEMEAERKASGGTNLMDQPPAKPVDTRKSESVAGYQSEIYTWSGPNHLTKTLWVAKDFPGYEQLKVELAKRDKFYDTGAHRAAQPEVGRLPGMVVMTLNELGDKKMIVTLVSAKAVTVEPSEFEIPAEYSVWQPPPMTNSTNPATMPGK